MPALLHEILECGVDGMSRQYAVFVYLRPGSYFKTLGYRAFADLYHAVRTRR